MSHKPPICSKTRGATAGSGESQLSTELEGAGFARAPLSQADESGEAPWVAGSSGVVSVVCVWGAMCKLQVKSRQHGFGCQQMVRYITWRPQTIISDQPFCGISVNSHSIAMELRQTLHDSVKTTWAWHRTDRWISIEETQQQDAWNY